LGEHQLDKLGVTGSSPVPPTLRKPRLDSGVSRLYVLHYGNVELRHGEASAHLCPIRCRHRTARGAREAAHGVASGGAGRLGAATPTKYFAQYDSDGTPAALLRFTDSARIEHLEADGTWGRSDKSVEQLFDATLDKIDAAEAGRVARSFGLSL
jgi:hypothetical protein